MAYDGRGDHYAANGVSALGRLGLGAGLRAAAAVLPTWSFHNGHGSLLCTTDLTDLWRGVGPCFGVTRMELQRLLVAQASPIPYRLGLAVVDLAPRGEGVTVEFGDGSTEGYDLVVGPDGLRSTVRRLAVSAESTRYAGTIGVAKRRPYAAPRP